ncbi:MAG: response regulator [Proteobacteria bacterium]|nr:response regulator [Pseudomonadota bacterium]
MAAAGRDAVGIIDDDPAALASLAFLLQALEYEVVAYGSAVDLLKDATVRAACLIVDQHMPEMTGLDLIARLRRDGWAMPVLLVSGALTPVLQARAAELGVRTLAKPFGDDELLHFVAAHVHSSTRSVS